MSLTRDERKYYNFVTRHMHLRTQLLCDSVEKVLWSIFEERECLEGLSNLCLALGSKSWAARTERFFVIIGGNNGWVEGRRRNKSERGRTSRFVVKGRRRGKGSWICA
jgi:hypothetical protein